MGSLAEDDNHGKVVSVSSATATALRRSGLLRVEPEGTDGKWRLLPHGKVGAVRAGEVDVMVTPKVGIERLLFLLGYAANPGFRPDDVQGAADDDLLPLMAESLARQAERALAAGVLQGYVTIDDALMTVRGRPRLGDQLSRRPGMLLPLEVRHDEYSADIPENRVLRSAMERMLTGPRLPAGTRARLIHLCGRLDGVGRLDPGRPPPHIRETRLNARYQPALRLAELVLTHQSLETGPGPLTTASFVVDMARVFEDFVTTAMREALAGRPGTTHGQYRTHLDASRLVSVRPDIVHTVDGTPRIVLDAKYKVQKDGPGTDLYQMLAYCTTLNLKRGWLAYAQGPTTPRTYRIRNTGIEVVARPLDLATSPTELLKQISHLADEIWEPPSPPMRP
ncbi:restriction endonuclease [Actinomadura sp. 6K520]|uniref:McrC family protein n=1 Tax=Actinomadura sp. 6K520 TaxID=2530364 RepID=UPI00104EB1B5|nr:restriction endonuclease [Actinomadura sp. 6K520]TDE26362.1 restriction endonuclease [Actinomadura sp. 6K520]